MRAVDRQRWERCETELAALKEAYIEAQERLVAPHAPDALRAAVAEYIRANATWEQRGYVNLDPLRAALASPPDAAACETCEGWRKDYNVAVANGRIQDARHIDRRMSSHEASGH